jgi:hypothetical protein
MGGIAGRPTMKMILPNTPESTRYFFHVLNNGKVIGLFRLYLNLDFPQKGTKGIEEVEWSGGKWNETTDLTGYMINGSHEIMEVDEETARSSFPGAFEEVGSKK